MSNVSSGCAARSAPTQRACSTQWNSGDWYSSHRTTHTTSSERLIRCWLGEDERAVVAVVELGRHAALPVVHAAGILAGEGCRGPGQPAAPPGQPAACSPSPANTAALPVPSPAATRTPRAYLSAPSR